MRPANVSQYYQDLRVFCSRAHESFLLAPLYTRDTVPIVILSREEMEDKAMRKNQKVKVRGDHKRAAQNTCKPRIGQVRVSARPMPHSMYRHAWLPDGSQVAIARSDDRYICGHFDASEKPLCGPVIFDGGDSETSALLWLKRQRTIDV